MRYWNVQDEPKNIRVVDVAPWQFKQSLHDVGVCDDELLMVHSSLRSFGHFEGGPEAVIDCLMEVVCNGTIVMPTYTRRSLQRNPKRDREEFDPATEPSIDGVITEHFRLRPDVIRQPNNPWHPQAVWGRCQKRLIESQPYAIYDFFLAHAGRVLLIGVGHETHSFVHWMLDEAEEEGLLARAKDVKSILFPRLEPWFVRQGGQRTVPCGKAVLRRIDVARARDAVKVALQEEPGLFGGPPTEEERSRRINTVERKRGHYPSPS